MPTVLITGGTGLVGTRLSKLLIEKGYKVTILTRQPEKYVSSVPEVEAPIQYAFWDVAANSIDEGAIQQADFIVHLAGAGVAEKRWTTERKAEIQDSRVKTSELIVHSLGKIPNNVRAVIASSAIGWYGADTAVSLQSEGFTESMPVHTDFLGETCRLWEAAITPAETLVPRVVKLRTGIVLSNEGGALKEFKKPLVNGLATILGNGNQIISWIHIEDLCRAYLYAIENELKGAYNVVAPKPCTNKELTLYLAKKMRQSFFVTTYVPKFILKIVLGEMSIEVLKSTKVSVGKLKKAGFTFLFPSIESALDDLIR